MNRQRVGQLVALITAVVVGPVGYSIYLPLQSTGGVDLADAGVTVTHIAHCPVRTSAACQARFGVALYERVKFGVMVSSGTAPDGGTEVLLPPLGDGGQADCVSMVDFSLCTLSAAAGDPTTATKYLSGSPFVLEASARQCGRMNTARGFGSCVLIDGGAPVEMQIYRTTELGAGCETVGLPVSSDGRCFVFSAPLNAGQQAEDQ